MVSGIISEITAEQTKVNPKGGLCHLEYVKDVAEFYIWLGDVEQQETNGATPYQNIPGGGGYRRPQYQAG